MTYLNSPRQHETATVPRHLGHGRFDGTSGLWLIDNGQFAWDSTNVTPTLDYIGSRPCVNLTNSGATATDGSQFQTLAASYQLAAAKKVHLWGGFRMSTTTQEFSFGWAAVDTSIIASEPTDHFAMQKLTGVTTPLVRARKASGTAQATNALNLTFAVDTWVDFELIVTRDASTAGIGAVQLYMGSGLTPGSSIPLLYSGTFASQIPDTVDLAPYGAWRAGSAANVSGYISHFGWLIQG